LRNAGKLSKVNSYQQKLKFRKLWSGEGIYDDSIMPVYRSELGILFKDDCLNVLPKIKSESINVVFADPPFNLGKKYGPKIKDKISKDDYINWSKKWIIECERVLKPGGAFFVYNLPKWNLYLGSFFFELGLAFRHWIAINIKSTLPLPGRLYPSHYSLLYFSKGKPHTFNKIRTPIEKCRHCGREIKDYGGHRKAMNPLGVNLTDVWNDIPPVRHWKFKSKKRTTNQLSTKTLFRIIQMTSNEGDIILDPFGGSGTTYYVCEQYNRRWVGIELGDTDLIIERLESNNIEPHINSDYVEK